MRKILEDFLTLCGILEDSLTLCGRSKRVRTILEDLRASVWRHQTRGEQSPGTLFRRALMKACCLLRHARTSFVAHLVFRLLEF